MNKRIVHDAFILAAFTLGLGLILAVVYEITKGPISEAKKAAEQKAFQAVFADADSFHELEYDKDEANDLLKSEGFSDTIDDIQEAVDKNNELLGYVITVTAKDASQGSITFSVGIQNDGTVNGYSITDIAETPGLGMKAEEEEFYSQFEGKNVSEFVVVKQEATADNEIESITSSTITSEAMANGCNAAIYYFQNELGGEK